MPRPSFEDRFFDKFLVNKKTRCWEWIGTTNWGYGRIGKQVDGKTKQLYAHRVSHEMLKGPIPDGYEIDHLCRNRKCVNPDHLEAVTPNINWIRGINITAMNHKKTHCIKGHKFNLENTYINPASGGRCCRKCIKRHRDNFASRNPHYRRDQSRVRRGSRLLEIEN